jgi:hypothetical protein
MIAAGTCMQPSGDAGANGGRHEYPAPWLKHLFRKTVEFLMEKYVESLISLEYDLPAIRRGRCARIFT